MSVLDLQGKTFGASLIPNSVGGNAIMPLPITPNCDKILLQELTMVSLQLGRSIAMHWPFEVTQVSVALYGALARADLKDHIGEAITLGLAGVGPEAIPAAVVSALALQRRMMAIRLNGRKLVAFSQARDLQYRSERLLIWPNRMRATAWSAGGVYLGQTEHKANHCAGTSVECIARSHAPIAAGDRKGRGGRESPDVVF